MRLYGSSSSAHPTWGTSGRPILIGDRAVHAELGPGVVRSVGDFRAVFRDKAHEANHTVQVGELFIEVEVQAELQRAIKEGI